MNEAESRQDTVVAADSVSPQQLTAAGLRKKLKGGALRVERHSVIIDGEVCEFDLHEVTGGERVAMLELAKKLTEGKAPGGSKRFYQELIARTMHVPDTKIRVFDERAKEQIDDLPQGVHEDIMKKAMRLNGMDPNAIAEAKNGSGPES